MRQKKTNFISLSSDMVDRIEKSLTLIADQNLPYRISVIEEQLKTLDSVEELTARLDAIEESNWMNKDVLTSAEAAKFLGFKMSYLYKLTADNRIPFYKPSGGSILFCKQELVDWAKSNPIPTSVKY